MSVSRKRIENNLKIIRQNIADACKRCGRLPEDVSIVAVTKNVEADTIKNLIDAGLSELAENQVQKLVKKAAEIEEYIGRRRKPLPAPVRWHMVGHLQRNKVRDALKYAGMVHSVDSLRLAETLSQRAQKNNSSVDVLLQVNCSQETQKYGCAVGAALHLGEMISSLPCLRLRGLMTMGPLGSDRTETRNSFSRLREIHEDFTRDKIGAPHFQHLSMGMTDDYEIAVEEGATILRIGRALFE